ncbi:type III secretion system effector protein [Paracidovorax avenae]|uniref:type III secretion system effector protein n=1 Tax=Paracidovorax avenae TaxID=80867 RepID=UPI000D173128|nr:type III secretion system effector protein [Paracidovorax avenae]AVS69213.1 type III secretion system effector protein [Paracidovorax avenae]
MFLIIKHLSFLSTHSTPGDVQAASGVSGNGVVFSRSKKALGGSDVGMIGKIDGEEHLVKTGISRSLLGQAVALCAKGQIAEANKRLGYIVSAWDRLVEGGTTKGALERELTDAFHGFLQSGKGRKLAEKAKVDELDINDVSDIHASLVRADPTLRNPLGIPVIFDTINVAAAQDMVNALQGTYLAKHHIPDSSLLTVENNVLIASRLVSDATPLDVFLTQPFLPDGVSLADAKRAASLIKAAAAGNRAGPDEVARAQALVARINDPANLHSGRRALSETLQQQGLDGLFMSLLTRLTLGESSDLGPDNMLVVPGADGRHQVVNIDVTGFRYDREKDATSSSQDPVRHGWGKVIENPGLALNVLLDRSVLNSRYAKGLDPVHEAVVDCLREVLHQNATPEAAAVKRWYAALDVGRSTASLLSLRHGLGHLSGCSWMPDADLVDRVLARNASFIDNIVQKSRT